MRKEENLTLDPVNGGSKRVRKELNEDGVRELLVQWVILVVLFPILKLKDLIETG